MWATSTDPAFPYAYDREVTFGRRVEFEARAQDPAQRRTVFGFGNHPAQRKIVAAGFAKHEARTFRKLKVSGEQVEKNVAKLTDELKWFKTLGGATFFWSE